MPLKDTAINEILPFAPKGEVAAGDLQDLEVYRAELLRLRGHQPGLARRGVANRALRQATHLAAGVSQFIANRFDPGVKDNTDLDAVERGLEHAVWATLQGHTHSIEEIMQGLGNPGQVIGMRGGKAVWLSVSGGVSEETDDDTEPDPEAPDLSGLIAYVPESILSTRSDYVQFEGIIDPNGLPVTISLAPLDGGLLFGKLSGIAQSEQVSVTAPYTLTGKRARLRMTAYNSLGLSASRSYYIDILVRAPDMDDITARVPAAISSGKSDYVSFDSLSDPGGESLLLSLDPLDSGLGFAKLSGIALGERVSLSAPELLEGRSATFALTARNADGFAATANFTTEITVSAPDISGLVAHVPESLVGTQSADIWFSGVRDPQGWPVTLSLEPISSGLSFAKTSGIALDEPIKMTAPDLTYNKTVTYRVRASNKAGKTSAKSLGLDIIGATPPNMQAFSHTVPPAILSQTSVNVSFAGAMGANGHAVTYRIDKGASGLSFAKTSGIAASEWVSMSAPYTDLAALPVSITVYAVDSVTGKEAGVEICLAVTGATPPDMLGFSHTIPASLDWCAVISNVSFTGAIGFNNNPLTYRIDPGVSGLTFSKVSNIAPNENISLTVPDFSDLSKNVSITVYAVDSVTGKEVGVNIALILNGRRVWHFHSGMESTRSWTVPYSGSWTIGVQGGGGGGGGGGYNANGYAGGGGGGEGSASASFNTTLTAGTTYTITTGKRGQGGAGGTASSSTGGNGTTGGSSSFGALKTVTGGTGGKGGTSSAGGAAATCTHSQYTAPTVGSATNGKGGNGGIPTGTTWSGYSGGGGQGGGGGGKYQGAAGTTGGRGSAGDNDPYVAAVAGATSAGGRGSDGGSGVVQCTYNG